MLHKVDPFNNQKMTYSEIVHLLSSHLTAKSEEDNEQIPILEKYINAEIDDKSPKSSELKGNHGVSIDNAHDSGPLTIG